MEDAREKGIEPREALLDFHKRWYSSNMWVGLIIQDMENEYLLDLQSITF